MASNQSAADDILVAITTDAAATAAVEMGEAIERYLKAVAAQDEALGWSRHHNDRVEEMLRMIMELTTEWMRAQ